MRHTFLVSNLVLATMCVPAHATDCGGLSHLKFGHVTVTAAKPLAAGTPISAGGEEIGAAKSDYCRVQGTSKPTADSDIRFELWVPSGAAWNGKFEQVGNGGFAGSLPYRSMMRGLSLGYAVAGTDDGHESGQGIDASWALNHPEKVKDYGWRALEETARASKYLLRKLVSKSPSKSYFFGCSDGGREALMMAQRFPAYFDGIIAGAPAYSMTRLLTSGALLQPDLRDPAGHLGAPQLMLLQTRALQSCGNGSAYLQDPRSCHVDLDALKCPGEVSDSCLTEAQIMTARAIFTERKDPRSGATLYAQLPGAEGLKGSWDAWITGPDDRSPPAAAGFVWNYLAYMVMKDPKFDMAQVTTADLVRGERMYAPIIDSESADLSAFKAHGGKLIQYHGWNDPAIPAGYSVDYRERLKAATGAIDGFYRLYMVPGMLHCGGGEAPTSVNWMAALEGWVERGTAPAELIAEGKGMTQTLHPVE